MKIVTLSERPDLAEAMWELPNTWPAFMFHDPVSDLLFELVPERFPQYQLIGLDDHDEVVSRVIAAPFHWDGTHADLPDRGWDAILERAIADSRAAAAPTAVTLLEARVVPGRQGAGLSTKLLQAGREHVARLGIHDLFGPVRPTAKSREPRTPMSDYVARLRDDGMPFDPWLRTHARLGGAIVKICPTSMTVTGTLAQWREWTDLPFTHSGLVDVPGALTPVHVSTEHDHGVYVEPNVWVHHRLGGPPGGS